MNRIFTKPDHRAYTRHNDKVARIKFISFIMSNLHLIESASDSMKLFIDNIKDKMGDDWKMMPDQYGGKQSEYYNTMYQEVEGLNRTTLLGYLNALGPELLKKKGIDTNELDPDWKQQLTDWGLIID